MAQSPDTRLVTEADIGNPSSAAGRALKTASETWGKGPTGDVTPAAIAARDAAQASANSASASATTATTAKNTAQTSSTAAQAASGSATAARDDAQAFAQSAASSNDTGWVGAGTAPSGVSWPSPVQYRIINNMCYWRGQVASTFPAGTWIKLTDSLPAACKPETSMPLLFSGSQSIQVSGGIYNDTGDIQAFANTTFTGAVRVGGSYPLALRPDIISVLQLNLWRGATKVSNGLNAVANIVRESRADVALFCETDNDAPDAIRNILASSGDTWYAVSAGNKGLVSRYPIVSSENPSQWWMKAILDVNGATLAVYPVHLQPRYYTPYLPRGYGGDAASGVTSEYGLNKIPTGPITDTAILSQVNTNSGRSSVMATVISNAQTERNAGRKVIIGGDFNEPSHLDWTASTKNTFGRNGVVYPWDTTKNLANAGYVDGYRSKYADPLVYPGITWPSDNPNVDVTSIEELSDVDTRDRLDFVFHRPADGLSLISARIVGPEGTVATNMRLPRESIDTIWTPSATWPSDHKGNLQRFRITR